MAAWLPSRAAVIARSTSISTGAIVGASIGSVVGATLVFLCVLPFILRARRLRAFRRKHGEDATVEELGQPDFLSRSHIGDAFRRLSHSTPSQPAPKSDAAGDGQESTDQNAEAGGEKPQTTLYPTGVNVHYGLPSPITPPLPAAARLEPLPGRALKDGRTATGSLTLATQTTQDSIPTHMLSQEQTITDAGTSYKRQSESGSFASPSRRDTSGSMGIAEGPGTPGLGRLSSHKRRSSHLSDSVRHLAQRASAALRRDSTLSTGSIRSAPLAPGDDLPQVVSAPAAFEPIDTEARGEAYSYYHGFDAPLPEPEPAPAPDQRSTYGPPLSIPATSTAALHPPIFTSPASASLAAPLSPVSPRGPPSLISPVPSRPTFGLGQGAADEVYEEPDGFTPASLREKRGLDGEPEPLKRMGTQPLKPIVSDIPSPPLPARCEPSVNPMDIWGPTTLPEKDHKTLVDLSTPSPPAETGPAPPMEPFPSQPTPDSTPEREPGRDMDVNMDEERVSPVLKQEPSPPGMKLPPPPEIAVTGDDIDMMESSGRCTPPASSVPSNPTTPGHLSDAHMTPGPSMGPLSPRSNDGPGDQSDSSPRIYKCDYCNTEFDQYHKLNHHTRYHDRPHICPHPGCTMRFDTKTHLGRHVNDKHTKSKHYFCTQRNCPYSRQGGKSFPRKDNWRRHMNNKHNIANPPDPEEVTMEGTGQQQQQLPLGQPHAQAEMMYDPGTMDGMEMGQPNGLEHGAPMSDLAYAQFLVMTAQQHQLGQGQQSNQYS